MTRPDRRGAHNRVFSDHDHADDTRDDLPAAGDEAEVQNLSGTPGDPGMSRSEQAVAFDQARAGRRERPGITPPRPGEDPSPRVLRPGIRAQVQVNAETGRALDTKVANLLTGEVSAPTKRHLSVKETVEQSDPHVRAAYLDHLFLPPGRDR